jgi:ABC-type nitrate/sulfonate/bicarbonate transport system substrate-binding protein
VLHFSFTGLSTSLDVIARRGDMLRRVIKSEIEAIQYMHADREGTLRIMAQRLEVEPEVAAQAYELIIGAISRDGTISREGMDNVLALDKEEGAIPEQVQFDDVVDPRPLQDVQRAMGLAR